MCNIDINHRKQTQVNYAEIHYHNTKTRRYEHFCIAHNFHIPQISGVWKWLWHCGSIKQIYDVLFVLMLRYRKPQSSYHHGHLCYNKWCHSSCGELWCHLMCRWGQCLSDGMVTISQEFRITIHFLAGNPESSHFSIKAWCDFKPLERSSISNWNITRPVLQDQTVSVS